MQTAAMSSNVLQARPISQGNSFKPARAGVHARRARPVRAQVSCASICRRVHDISALAILLNPGSRCCCDEQAEQKVQGPAKAASAVLTAVAAAQFAFSGRSRLAHRFPGSEVVASEDQRAAVHTSDKMLSRTMCSSMAYSDDHRLHCRCCIRH